MVVALVVMLVVGLVGMAWCAGWWAVTMIRGRR